ncbi:MAG TPA: biotin--[acetyl-CoA-carboxylase] ligase, partial [Chloroflexota bacterium]
MPDSWRIPVGWQLSYRAVTGSTNDDGREAASFGSGGPVVFLADDQWAGRGRYGRSWIAPAESSLLFSILARTSLEPILLTATCSVAVAEVLREATGLAARIKWPNDVMVGERKICGVLTEVVGAAPAATIVGLGLNVNLALDAPGLPETATSVSAELGRPFSRQLLFERIIARIDTALRLDPAELAAATWMRWEALLWRRSQLVRVADGGQKWEGIVEGL